MTYDGKFRDFMVGWLALQVKRPGAATAAIESLYEAIVSVENDKAALIEAEKRQGQLAHRLWVLSERWYDPTIEAARPMIDQLRQHALADFGEALKFYLFFLNPFKLGCIPDGFEENLEREIGWMYRVFHEAAGAGLAAKRWVPYVVVVPSYEDASEIIVLAYPQQDEDRKVFIGQFWHKAWNLRFSNLAELAQELLLIRDQIEHNWAKAMASRKE